MAVLLVVAFAGTARAAEDPDRVIVRFRTLDANARAALRSAGGATVRELPQLNAIAARLPLAARAGLARNPNVTLVETDARRHPIADTYPWGVVKLGADKVWEANRDGVLDAGAPTGAGPLVCVIDSGIDTTHPDLAGVAVGGYPTGWNTDGCHHGTHVSGTIAARLGGAGVVGVAPGANVYMVKVFGSTCAWSYASDLVDAAYRCKNAGAKIISMSLGGPTASSTESQAFATLYASGTGILSIAAAGNAGTSAYSYPASYDAVVSVAAVDSNGQRASFSQYNSKVELAAPGVGVLSTVPGGGWESWDGTSMATPHVSGAAALVWSADPALTAGDIRQVLRTTATDLATAGWDSGTGYGLVRADLAVAAVTTLNRAPTASIASPASSSTFAQDSAIVFAATASDAEDGDVSASFVWTSNIAGRIGTGATFTTSTLAAGTHVVTATASDSAGLTGAASVTVKVVALDTTPPAISGVSARSTDRKGTVQVTWTTNEPSNSRVRLTCCGVYSDAAMVTSHKVGFRGSKGTTYTYYVASTDAAGNASAESGPYTVAVPR